MHSIERQRKRRKKSVLFLYMW
ncbi:hypothetical protein NC652_003763 [Populus alba x Populus x berolinensis]|nr:hypothetical protein NC652_003763 [Populus alba x Populus x berolinensis]